MSMPENIPSREIKYFDNGEIRELAVSFSSDNTSSNYRTYSPDMEARRYVANDEGTDAVRNICLVANRNADEDAIAKAVEILSLAIIRHDLQRHFEPSNLRGEAWPLHPGMLSGFEDGRYKPRGFAAIIRYVEESRLATTDIELPAYYADIPEEV